MLSDLFCSKTADDYPYLTCWHLDLHPALRGVAKVDLNDCFHAPFLLSVEDGNHNIPEHLALFVHTLCHKVRERSEFAVELGDIGFTIVDSYVCGYIQFRPGWLCSASEWLRSVSDLWVTDLYGLVYDETNTLIVSSDMLRAQHPLVTAAVS